MEEWGKFLEGLSGFAWPLLILLIGWIFQEQIQGLLVAVRRQLASGAAWKWKDFEFKGVDLESFDEKGKTAYQQEPADKILFQQRHESYRVNKNLFLVHRARPTGLLHKISGLPTYDISVYLISHKSFGHINDVKEVQYYFGQHFGLTQSEFGTRYVVRNGTDWFAIRINAYGPMLCEARVIFHDGSETTVSRYLDFEGTGYRFEEATNQTDEMKIKNRLEVVG
jgi:hypothetical protein